MQCSSFAEKVIQDQRKRHALLITQGIKTEQSEQIENRKLVLQNSQVKAPIQDERSCGPMVNAPDLFEVLGNKGKGRNGHLKNESSLPKNAKPDIFEERIYRGGKKPVPVSS
jgi:hypothetical protein